MHSIFFGMKRAYQSSLRITRRIFKRLRLTAARFDLLYSLASTRRGERRQSDLRRRLGVTAPTVSRMVKSLVALGYVTRTPAPEDARQRYVTLTPEGRRRLWKARCVFIRSGWVQLAIDSALMGSDWLNFKRVFEWASSLEHFLDLFRHEYRDTGYIYYPWHPDD